MSHINQHLIAASPSDLRARRTFGPLQWLQLVTILSLWHRRMRTRAHLARLDEAGLRDIGMSEAERRAECARPFWQGADR